MQVYSISGSAELFPQHCQVPNLSPTKHLKALMDKLAKETTNAINTPKGTALIKILRNHLDALIPAPPAAVEQRVTVGIPTVPPPKWNYKSSQTALL